MGIDQFYKAWPNVKEDQSDSDYTSFWEHEWTKHGTCSNLDQASFYKYTLSTRPLTPKCVGDNYGGNTTLTELQDAYSTDVVLDCQGTFLNQIFVCVGVDYLPIDCPASVLSESTCKDGIVMIAEFDDARR